MMTTKQRSEVTAYVSRIFADAVDAAINGNTDDCEDLFNHALGHLIRELSPDE